MTCNCIAEVDAMLATRNTRLALPIMFGSDQTPRLMIETEQVEKGRGKAKAVTTFSSFCPFCGVAHKEASQGVGDSGEGK